MKKLIFSLSVVFCTFLSFSQIGTEWGVPYQDDKKVIIYEEVVAIDGQTKAVLYSKAINWINSYFTAGAKKITEKNVEEGIIKLKDRINIYKIEKKTKVNDVIVEYTLEIYLKDNKYKYIISNFKNFQGSTSYSIEKWMDIKYADEETAKRRYKDLNDEISKMTESLKAAMISEEKPKDDW